MFGIIDEIERGRTTRFDMTVNSALEEEEEKTQAVHSTTYFFQKNRKLQL